MVNRIVRNALKCSRCRVVENERSHFDRFNLGGLPQFLVDSVAHAMIGCKTSVLIARAKRAQESKKKTKTTSALKRRLITSYTY